MKKLLCMLLCTVSVAAFAQDKSLYKFNVLKTKGGSKSSFEDLWKIHMDKFHNLIDKRLVYEVISGSNKGSYIIVEGPLSTEEVDKVQPNKKEHELDLDKSFSRQLGPGSSSLFSWIDSLSHPGNNNAEELMVTNTVLKEGKIEEYIAELRRDVLVNTKLNISYSTNVFIKQQAGSKPSIITKKSRMEGFNELDNVFTPVNITPIKDEYIKEFGQDAWDKRAKILSEAVVSREQHFEKYRSDLSSK